MYQVANVLLSYSTQQIARILLSGKYRLRNEPKQYIDLSNGAKSSNIDTIAPDLHKSKQGI